MRIAQVAPLVESVPPTGYGGTERIVCYLTEELVRRQSEARFASLVQHSSDLITVLAPDATIAYQSPAIERVLGWTPEEVMGRRIDELVDKSDNSRLLRLIADGNEAPVAGSQTLECSLAHRDGGTRQFEVLFTNLTHDEHVGGIVLNSRDVSERKAFERQLAHQAFHDPVTGLPNRALFVERVRHALARSRREQRGIGIVFVDLDDFKIINDSLGHAAGDEVLNQVAQRLALSIRASDTAARFGGDEFAVLLEDIEGVQEAADAAERIMEAISAPLTAAHKELAVRCSLGITIAAEDGSADADELIRDADAAMYIAKRDGKGGYRLFEPDMHEGVLQRLELRTDLQRALDFYCGVLGFEVTYRRAGAAFISAGGYHHHIGLNTWESRGGHPPAPGTTGLQETRKPVAVLCTHHRIRRGAHCDADT